MILVTNDDGDSEGLRMLLGVAKTFGKAYAIVPNRQRSAVSGALTLHKPLRLHRHAEDMYSVNGTPSDCVLFALFSKEFEKPDLVLSGINWGDNSGIGSLLGSGTVGACWQAAIENVPSIAFSVVKGEGDWRDAMSWGDRGRMKDVVGKLIKDLRPKLKRDMFFNVNMPRNLDKADIVHVKRLQRERYKTEIVKKADPDGRPYYWISGKTKVIEKNTDVDEVIGKGNIAITEISMGIFNGD